MLVTPALKTVLMLPDPGGPAAAVSSLLPVALPLADLVPAPQLFAEARIKVEELP
jgi:hypothetical protein